MQDYLEKARKAEEAGLKSTSTLLRDGWLQVARSYRLLARRNADAGKTGKEPAPPSNKGTSQ